MVEVREYIHKTTGDSFATWHGELSVSNKCQQKAHALTESYRNIFTQNALLAVLSPKDGPVAFIWVTEVIGIL